MLSTRGLTWTVGSRRILDGVDLHVGAGSFVGLLGPNGSGKSTLLNLLAGLRRPSSGQVLLGTEDLHCLSARARARRIAFVEQESATELDLTVTDVVGLGRIPHRGRWGSEPEEVSRPVVESAMAAVGVTGLAGRAWRTLSGGERQRTQLARALAQRPEVLLLDEPTNHLDLHYQLDFLGRVRDLGITTVAALHDLESAAAFCDEVVVLAAGRVAAAGPVQQVITPDLVGRVFAVDVDVEQHPHHDRPHVRWNGTV